MTNALRFKVAAAPLTNSRRRNRMSTSAAAPLWPQPMPVIGGTGLPSSGKTKFGLNICPGPLTTLVYDLEQSATSYEGAYASMGVPFVRVDVQREMHTLHPNGYKPIQLWEWWLKHIRAVPSGKYRVIQVDPVTDLERGLTDWVAANPAFFGHTAGQYASMSGIMWGDVKDYEKMILADICARCETFYFTAHVGAEFADKKPTGKHKPKGKETLFQLASLYLWFDRAANPKTGERPKVPSAIVMKGRFESTELIDGEVVSYDVLPPKLPVASPKAIRDYFKSPAGKKGLTEGERVREEVMSADDRLKLETAKAEAEAAAAQARAAEAQAKQPTVVITHAPDERNTNSADAWVYNFTAAIQQAETPGQLNELPPQIKAARQQNFIGDADVSHLRSIYGERKAHLESLAESGSPE
jgi:hypothetical protein